MLDTFEAHFQIHGVKIHRTVHFGAKIFLVRFLEKSKANPLAIFLVKKSNCSDSSVHFMYTTFNNGKHISTTIFSKFPITESQRIFLSCTPNIKFIISHELLRKFAVTQLLGIWRK